MSKNKNVNDFPFKFPSHATLNARSSTISNAFIQTLTPWLTEKEEEGIVVYKKYCEEDNGCRFNIEKCFYCGAEAGSSDHIIPLVSGRKANGVITEIYNLIPCCSTCNSSKGSSEFKEWYTAAKSDIIKQMKDSGLGSDKEECEEIYNARLKTIPELCKELQYANPRNKAGLMRNGKYICYEEDIDIYKALNAAMDERDELIERIKDYHAKCLNVRSLIEKEILEPKQYIINKFSRIINDANKLYRSGKEYNKDLSLEFSDALNQFFADDFYNMSENELRIVKGTKGASSLNEKYTYRTKNILGVQYHYAFYADKTGIEKIDKQLSVLEKTLYK